MPENVPTRLVERARRTGLGAIGICDHNASENVTAVRAAAAGSGVAVFGGMEITSREEVHLLAVFDNDNRLARLQELVYRHLPGTNDIDAFGQQYIVDREDYVRGINEHLLMGAAELSVERVVEAVRREGGLAVAAHVDRQSFGIISQLGMIPAGLELDAVELSRHYRSTPFDLEGIDFPRVMFSDAHCLDDIGKVYTVFVIEEPTIRELRKALQGRDGRAVALDYEG